MDPAVGAKVRLWVLPAFPHPFFNLNLHAEPWLKKLKVLDLSSIFALRDTSEVRCQVKNNFQVALVLIFLSLQSF